MRKKTCLAAVPIGVPGSAIRQRSDLLLHCVIEPALEQLGYNVIRLDLSTMPGSIPAQVRGLALTCDLVIADLTGANANVLYELGLRHAVSRPFVQLVERGCPLPFDVADLRTLIIDTSSEQGIANAILHVAEHSLASEAVSPRDLERYLLTETSDSQLASFIEGSSRSRAVDAGSATNSHDVTGRAYAQEPQSPLHPPRWTKLDFLDLPSSTSPADSHLWGLENVISPLRRVSGPVDDGTVMTRGHERTSSATEIALLLAA